MLCISYMLKKSSSAIGITYDKFTWIWETLLLSSISIIVKIFLLRIEPLHSVHPWILVVLFVKSLYTSLWPNHPFRMGLLTTPISQFNVEWPTGWQTASFATKFAISQWVWGYFSDLSSVRMRVVYSYLQKMLDCIQACSVNCFKGCTEAQPGAARRSRPLWILFNSLPVSFWVQILVGSTTELCQKAILFNSIAKFCLKHSNPHIISTWN